MLSEDLLNESNEKVLKALAAQHSAAFLELLSLSGLEDDELRDAIKQFKDLGIVTITNPNDVFQEVVTLKDEGFAFWQKYLAEKKTSASTHSSAHSLA